MPLQSRKRLILAKNEATYGTDSSPVGSEAILVRDLNITPMESDTVSRDLVRPYYGATEQLQANTRVSATFSVEMAGSGTAGTAPRFDPVLQACGFSRTAFTPAVTGTATAGALNSITLAVGASATNNIYRGLILRITGGTGAGTVALVTGYVGSTRVATLRPLFGSVTPTSSSVYSIGLQTAYDLISSAFSSATIHYNIDGVLHRLTGCRGSVAPSAVLSEIPRFDFTMTGIYNPPTDTAQPAASYADQATPLLFNASNSGGFSLMGYSGCLSSVSLDLGNEIIYRELVNCAKEVLLNDRAVTGSVLIEAPTIAQKDFFTAALTDGTLGDLSFIHGTTAGNIVGMLSNRVDISAPSYEDQNGVHMLNVPVTLIPSTAGNDELRLVFA